MIVRRPVWRRFSPAFVGEAARFVAAGGHAAILRKKAGAPEVETLVLGVEPGGGITALGFWALLALGGGEHAIAERGPFAGLAVAGVPEGHGEAVLDLCARDAGYPSPTRTLRLSCTRCGACCHDGRVELGPADLERFRLAGRPELGRRPFVRRAPGGTLRLVMLRGGRCKHLGPATRCRIYELRPESCRAFLAGSEACLAAREETLGIRDGLL